MSHLVTCETQPAVHICPSVPRWWWMRWKLAFSFFPLTLYFITSDFSHELLLLLLFHVGGTKMRNDGEIRETRAESAADPAWVCRAAMAVKVPPLCSQDSSPTLTSIPPAFHLNSLFIDVLYVSNMMLWKFPEHTGSAAAYIFGFLSPPHTWSHTFSP